MKEQSSSVQRIIDSPNIFRLDCFQLVYKLLKNNQIYFSYQPKYRLEIGISDVSFLPFF